MQRKHVKQKKNELCKSSKSRIKVQKNFLFKNSKNNYLKADYNFFASLSNKMGDRTNAFEECIEEVSREQTTHTHAHIIWVTAIIGPSGLRALSRNKVFTINGVFFLFLSFFRGCYFSLRRSYHRVLKLVMGFKSQKK